MHRYLYFVLLLLVINGCSKKGSVDRTNFAELTIDGKKFTFDELEAVIDTTALPGIRCYVRLKDKASNSELTFKTITGSDRIIGSYRYPGGLFPDPALEYLHLSTYVNGKFSSYQFGNDMVSVIIYKVANGRMAGTIAGKAACITCVPYAAEVSITGGAFELAYRYQ